MKFKPRTQTTSLATSLVMAIIAAAISFTGMTSIARAESDPMARHQTRIDTGVRFPGDVAFKEGTIRTSGPDKGAYIERCNWVFDPNVSKGFGLTQHCIRYTMENTK